MPERKLSKVEALHVLWWINEQERSNKGLLGELNLEAVCNSNPNKPEKVIRAITYREEPLILCHGEVKGEFDCLLSCGKETMMRLEEKGTIFEAKVDAKK